MSLNENTSKIEQLLNTIADLPEAGGGGSGGNVDLTGYATEQYVQDYAQPKGNYLTEHQDISGKLDASALPIAINTALAQAKASGEFDGKDGNDGKDGQDGYTPVKGVDYFDGVNGVDGKDGYTPQKGIDYFDGEPGEPGKTPVKGEDYFTDADKLEIAEQAAQLVEIPEGGNVELDTTLTASGKAADAKSVGDALNGKLDKSGGTLNGNLTIAGNIILPSNGSAGIRDNTDNPMFRNETIDGEFSLRIGHKGARLHLYSSERPKYNGNEIALKKEIPDVSGITPYPGDDHINDLIDTALGVIENGTY